MSTGDLLASDSDRQEGTSKGRFCSILFQRRQVSGDVWNLRVGSRSGLLASLLVLLLLVVVLAITLVGRHGALCWAWVGCLC